MLYLMRKHATSWMIKGILIVVALSFIAWGGYRMREERLVRVATANGEPITIGEFRETYRNLIEQLQQSFGNALNEQLIKTFQVEKQALDRLIDQKLLIQEARKLNFRVSDGELARSIRSMPIFQDAGVFDTRRYRQILGTARLSAEDFEAQQKDSILIQKVRSFVTDTVKISDGEAWEWYRWQNATVDVDYVLFESEKYSGIDVTPEAIETHFKDNPSAYKTEPKVKVRYLFFDPKTYASKVQVSAAEIDDYYTAHPDEFKIPKTVEARHILFRVAPDAADADAEAARKKAEDVLKLAREGEDFAGLAKQYSEGPTRAQGGYLGTFEKEAMVEPFGSTAFSMKAGEISEPVRTRFGWHIIKVEAVNEAAVVPETEAKEKIRTRLIEERSKTLASDHAESVYETIFDGDDLSKVAQEKNLTHRVTDFFTRRGPEGTEMKNSAQFAAAAFDLSIGQISEIKDFGDGHYILQAVENAPETIPELTQVQERVGADLIRKLQGEKALADASAFLKTLQGGKPVAEATAAFGIQPASSGFFKRNDPIPTVGYEPAFAAAAFRLTNTQPLPESPVKSQKGYYVIRFKERRDPAQEDFNKEKKSVEENLTALKRQKAFESWLSKVRGGSEIVIQEGFLKSES